MRLTEEEIHQLRPAVRRWYPRFIEYVKMYGADTVRKALKNNTRAGKHRLTAQLNTKDRFQMLQMLDLV